MMTSEVPRPFFVGGPLHGRAVPKSLSSKTAIIVSGLGSEAGYLKTLWWRPGGCSFYVFCQSTIGVDDLTAIVSLMLQTMKLNGFDRPYPK